MKFEILYSTAYSSMADDAATLWQNLIRLVRMMIEVDICNNGGYVLAFFDGGCGKKSGVDEM